LVTASYNKKSEQQIVKKLLSDITIHSRFKYALNNKIVKRECW